MVKKKIDNRIRVMIENGVKLGHRTMFIIIGDKARDQVPILYDILTKCTVKTRPSVLWCYKTKDEAISNHGMKRAKKIAAGKIDINEADLFDTFRASTTIHGRYYSETHAILGCTYGVCVLQDFEALTPNLLARTIETVEGGGLIILLLKTLQSLKQLYTMSMDVHKRFRTEAHQTVTCRFNERLILSLSDCKRCLVINDDLTILPLSSKTANVEPVNPGATGKTENYEMLSELKESLRDTPLAEPLVALCKTYDQAKAVAQFIEALADKHLKPPTVLTAARGRGKSAALGLAIAAAIGFGYVNVYVTSPHPENLITLFEFTLKGFDSLEYQEHTDYTIIRSTNPDYKKAIVRINITRSSRQTIQYIAPSDTHLLNAADLLLIDEAAAIPLPLVKKMIGPYLMFMASTINGYEGTGRSLSLKLMSQLQREHKAPPPIKLHESIRYSPDDDIEAWLITLLCLDVTMVADISSGCPTPDSCDLYYINRDALFSYHKAAESFLHRLVSIYVASHYKNSPNDLQMMSDAPAHQLFCLLGPIHRKDQLPEILVIIQATLEGEISRKTIKNSLGWGKKGSGDLIPWNISEQFGDFDFPQLSGLRIVRIATHPNYQRMGYGKRAITLLRDYYEGKFTDMGEDITPEDNLNGIEEVEEEELGLLKETIAPRRKIPTLLCRLSERRAENIDYLGTSYGLTKDLLKFWKYVGFVPLYISQRTNDLTGEHSCIMLQPIDKSGGKETVQPEWLNFYFADFKRRIIKLLGRTFQQFPTNLALSILDNRNIKPKSEKLTKDVLDVYFLQHDIQRLELYSRNQVEFRLIVDLVGDISSLYFQDRMPDLQINVIQKAILLAIGAQGKTVDAIGMELDMPGNQILAKFYDMMKKVIKYFLAVIEGHIECTMLSKAEVNRGESMVSVPISLNDELDRTAEELYKKQREELKKLKTDSLKEFTIKGTEEDWTKALSSSDSKSKLISVKSGVKRLDDTLDKDFTTMPPKKKKFGKKNKG